MKLMNINENSDNEVKKVINFNLYMLFILSSYLIYLHYYYPYIVVVSLYAI